MIIILLAILLLVIGLIYIISKKIFHPTIILFSLWFVIISFAYAGMYDMIDINVRTYYIIFLGLFSFFIGNLFSSFFIRKNNVQERETLLNFNWKFAYIFLYISLFGTSILFFVTFKYLLLGYSFSQIHNMFYGYGEANKLLSDFLNSIVTWISLPSLYLSIFVAIISFFDKKSNKKFILLTILSLFFYIIGNASRMILIIVVLSIFVMFLYYNENISKKTKRYIKILIILLLLLFLILTFLRTSSSSSSVNSLYAYMSIPVALLDKWINIFDSSVSFNYTYGGSFFYGIISWINWFISKVGYNLPIYNIIYQHIIDTQNVWFQIFPGKVYNAYCTMFYYFYMDFGIFGIFLESFIFGILAYIPYKNIVKYKNKKYLLYYLLIFQCILFSFVRWTPATASFIIELLGAKLIVNGNKIKKEFK